MFFGNLDADKYDRNYGDSALFGRIWAYVRQQKALFWGIIGAFSLLAIVSSLRPLLITWGVDALEQNQDSLVPLLLLALLVSALFEYGLNYARRLWIGYLISRLVAQMRRDAFQAALNRDLAFYDTNKTGKVVSRITTDTQEFADVMILTSDVISQVISLVVLLVVLIDSSLILTLILLATMPMFVITAVFFRNLARKVTRKGSRAMAVVNDNIQESVTGISVAKNFRREAMIYDEFRQVNELSYKTNLTRGFVFALVFPVMNGLIGLAIGVIVYVGAGYALDGTISAAEWFLFIQAVDRFLFPLINFASFWSQLQQGLSAAERVFALIDADNTLVQHDSRPADGLRGAIRFHEVDFSYLDGQPVLKKFNLDIRAGENVAFVGHTGSGKSTIAKLVARFYEFQGGTIEIDGQDIRGFDLQNYRAHLGIVPQQPFLFSGTIMENVRYARPDATDDEIAALAHSIGGGEWLETLPQGLHSHVGERGARLSMGQRQLVSLLRVLVQKPAIFILDEATASIDPFTEVQIQDAVQMILAQSTSILVAHRLSTVRSADRIIVLREGEIIEEGSHEQLMAQGGHYAELYNTYFRHQSLDYVENARAMLEGA